MMKKSLIFTVLMSMLATGCSVQTYTVVNAAAPIALKDIDNHWAKDSITRAIEKGYVDGYEDATFRPDQTITRAEFIKMAVTAQGIAKGEAGKEWYQEYVNAALQGSIHNEKDFKEYTSSISRLEMARISLRSLDKNQIGESDDQKLIYDTVKLGLMQGMQGGELALDQTTTRAQAVTIIERILSVQKGEKLPVDKTALSYAEIDYRHSNIETMTGMTPTNLPITHEVSGVTMTVKQVIVVDMTDPNSAYYDYFRSRGATKEYRAEEKYPITEDYFIAIRLAITNKEERSDAENVSLRFIADMGGFYSAALRSDIAPVIDYSKLGTVEGWYCFAKKKEKVEAEIKQYKSFPLYLTTTTSGADFIFSK
ncbi:MULTISPECIES: S-layer homology domain-containing protein [unclassified Paenibacillus]|uniref:S-layer homology domain-containing protein n=1 Tax=unclassified Paenibacillus TaxID=185978 RepID=UPI001AE3DB1D|nr:MULTISPECIES: S-layer homology domain-containing protein [unclassified Paenibacillus]MBP1157124.1 hypothetical protein [Paenibacillus sp. PvP091]MBP1172137.1 hypothetical protein [Paenibacillus sp. PvR098]MBP2438518.1 hypothetical protein [Paenibacillus sp. PvP052]